MSVKFCMPFNFVFSNDHEQNQTNRVDWVLLGSAVIELKRARRNVPVLIWSITKPIEQEKSCFDSGSAKLLRLRS